MEIDDFLGNNEGLWNTYVGSSAFICAGDGSLKGILYRWLWRRCGGLEMGIGGFLIMY